LPNCESASAAPDAWGVCSFGVTARREVDFVVDIGGRLELFEAKWTEVPTAGDTVNLDFVRNVDEDPLRLALDQFRFRSDMQWPGTQCQALLGM
jgi:hypothetical protein